MTRLSIRLFLAFWAVIVLSLVAVVTVNTQVHRYRHAEQFEREGALFMEQRVIEPARRALAKGGKQGLARWLSRTRPKSRYLHLHVIDPDGADLLTGSSPRQLTSIIRAWQSGRLDNAVSAPHRWTRVLVAPDGGEFLLVLARRPRPLVFRLFGPFGPLGLLLVAIVLSGLASFALARYIARPLHSMRRAGSALGSGDLDARLPARLTRRHDEIGGLARDFNRMAEQLSRTISSQRQLLRDVSHELRSPLARIQVALSLAERDQAPRHLQRIRLESERLETLVEEILTYTRLQHTEALAHEPFDLADCVCEIVRDARLEGHARRVEVVFDSPEQAPVVGDESVLRRAIENALRNAVRHSPDGQTVIVRLAKSDAAFELSVADCGPGVDPEDLERMFEPFVRLSPGRNETGTGGGIGLAIARTAVERHGGEIQAQNRESGGLVIRLLLPRDQPES